MNTTPNSFILLQPPVPLRMSTQHFLFHYLLFAFLLCVIAGVLKGIYNRCFHPLRNFPGPFWGSFTDFYKLYIFASKHIPSATMDLHEQYGLFSTSHYQIER